MLRQDLKTGTVIKLADRCETSPYNQSGKCGCYVDDCVLDPAGKYRYGFAIPYECCEGCCGTVYYADNPTGGLYTDCTQEYEKVSGVPWGDDISICGYGGNNLLGCSVTGTLETGVLSFNGAILVLGLLLLALGRRRERK